MTASRVAYDQSILLDLLREGSLDGSPDDILNRISKLLMRKLYCKAVFFIRHIDQKPIIIIPKSLKLLFKDNNYIDQTWNFDKNNQVFMMYEGDYYVKLGFGLHGYYVVQRTKPFDQLFYFELELVMQSLQRSYDVAIKLEEAEKNQSIIRSELSRLGLLETFFNSAKDAFQVANIHGEIVFMNKTAQERLGIVFTYERKIYVWDFEKYFLNKTNWIEHIEMLKKVQNISVESTNTNLITKNTFPVEVNVSLQFIDNEIYVVAVSREISDRKILEEQIKKRETLLYFISKTSNILLKNNNLKLNVNTALETISKVVQAEYHLFYSYDSDIKKFKSIKKEYINSDLSVEEQELIDLINYDIDENLFMYRDTDLNESTDFVDKKMNPIIFCSNTQQVQLLPIMKNDSLWGLIGFVYPQDISILDTNILFVFCDAVQQGLEREEYENQIILSRDNAENARIDKENFIASVSHEMRTPLNSINSFIQELLYLDHEKEVEELIRLMNIANKHLLQIINNLLDLSKLAAGKFELSPSNFAFSEIINEIEAITKPMVKAKNILFDINIDILTNNLTYFADSIRVKQILLNFIHNAIKFTDTGRVTLNVKTIESNKMNEQIVEIEIIDTGIGMTQDFLNHIFDKYSQERNSSINYSKIQGAGLGMGIAKELIDLMNGQVRIESQINQGTRIILKLPLQSSVIHSLIKNENYEQENNILKNIVLIDDDHLNHFILERICKRNEFNLISFYSGNDAVEAVNNTDMDLILLDINLPDLNGRQVLKLIHQRKQIPIIGLSGITEDKIIKDLLTNGFVDFLSKPFDENELIKKIRHNLRANKLADSKMTITKNYYNIKIIEALSGGDKGFLVEMLSLFIKNLIDCENVLKQSKEQSIDAKYIKGVAHKNKSGLKMIEAFYFVNLLEKLEKEAIDSTEFSHCIEHLLLELPKLIDQLNSDLKAFT